MIPPAQLLPTHVTEARATEAGASPSSVLPTRATEAGAPPSSVLPLRATEAGASPSSLLPIPKPLTRIALAHDWLVGYRGGEAVLESIARIINCHHTLSRLYTMFADGHPIAAAIDAAPRTIAHLGRLPGASGPLRRWLLPAYPSAIADLSRRLAADHAREPIDLLISTSSAAIKGLAAPPGVPHLCYCHAPARYLWSQADQYARGSGGLARALGLGLFTPYLRAWDRRTASNVSTFLANSSHTAAQIREFYGRDAIVLAPPVRTSFFTPPTEPTPRDGSWLFVGALEPYKRADLAIHAAAAARVPLTIIGSGTQSAALRARAGPQVRFLGRVDDATLREHYRRASVLLFPQVEDFGITAVEAQACGTPVAAFRAGGALDSVIDGRTGVFFDEPTPEALAAAAAGCARLTNAAAACRDNAERFDEAEFEREVEGIITAALPRPT